MSDVDSKASNRLAERDGIQPAELHINRMLVMRPKSFFSNEFYMEYADENPLGKSSPQAIDDMDCRHGILDLRLISTIIIFGLPFLVYCVISST